MQTIAENDAEAVEAPPPPNSTWSYLFAIAMVMLGIGTFMVRSSNVAQEEQMQKIRKAQMEMDGGTGVQ